MRRLSEQRSTTPRRGGPAHRAIGRIGVPRPFCYDVGATPDRCTECGKAAGGQYMSQRTPAMLRREGLIRVEIDQLPYEEVVVNLRKAAGSGDESSVFIRYVEIPCTSYDARPIFLDERIKIFSTRHFSREALDGQEPMIPASPCCSKGVVWIGRFHRKELGHSGVTGILSLAAASTCQEGEE